MPRHAHSVDLPAAEVVDDNGVYRCDRYIRLSDCGEEHEQHLRRIHYAAAVRAINSAHRTGRISAHEMAHRLRLIAPWGRGSAG